MLLSGRSSMGVMFVAVQCDLCKHKDKRLNVGDDGDIEARFADAQGIAEDHGWMSIAVGKNLRSQTVRQICKDCVKAFKFALELVEK